MDAIEKLLSDEEGEEKDLEKAEAPAPEESAEQKGDDEKVKKENAQLKRELARRQKELDALKAAKEEKTEELKADPADPLTTREGWLAEIDRRAEAKLAPLKESNLRKARDRFIASHPEYAGETGKTKLRSVFDRAKVFGLEAKHDVDEMMECLLDAWAVENRKELEKAAEERSKSRERAQKMTSSAAAAGGGSEKVEDDFTEAEREQAAKHGMTPERYREAEKRLADAEYSL